VLINRRSAEFNQRGGEVTVVLPPFGERLLVELEE